MATTGAPNQKYNAADEPDLVNGPYAVHVHEVEGTFFGQNSINVTNLVDAVTNTSYPVLSESSTLIICETNASYGGTNVGFCRLFGTIKAQVNIDPDTTIAMERLWFTIEKYREAHFSQGGIVMVETTDSSDTVINSYPGIYAHGGTTISSNNFGLYLYVPGLTVTEEISKIVIYFC